MAESPWEQRAVDWAEVMEGWNGWGVPVYGHVLGHIDVGQGTDLLDVGCGAGRFCRIAADRGANVAGLDATRRFVEIAGERVMGGDFRLGDMKHLPWPDDSFDVVTGFNSFFIAPDMVAALAEARRVTRPGGRIATTVFGRPEHCQSTSLFGTLRQFAPPGGNEDDQGPALHEEGVLEARAAEAGLTPLEAGYLSFAEQYPDLATMLRGYLAAPPFARAIREAGEEAVREALTHAIEPLRTEAGIYVLEEEIRFVIAAT